MRAWLIFSLALAGLGIVRSEDDAALCKRHIKFYCRPEYVEWEANQTATYSEDCKKTFAGIKDEFAKKYANACLMKKDDKTCEALYEVHDDFFAKMRGYECLPISTDGCKKYFRMYCVKKLSDDETYIKIMTKLFPHFGTDACIKKIKEVRTGTLKELEAACDGQTNLKKLSKANQKKICQSIHQVRDEYSAHLKADCEKKTN